MRLLDYIKKCLEDKQFKKIWEEENPEFSNNIMFESKNMVTELSLSEALSILETIEDNDLTKIINNKGVHPNIDNYIKTEVIFYEQDNNCPVEDFLNSIIDNKLKSKTLRNILELAMEGNNAKPSLSKYVDDGIFELRTKQGSNIDRIFYFFIFGNKIIMTNGYIKKTQKLDEQEFKKAKKYRDNYMKKFK